MERQPWNVGLALRSWWPAQADAWPAARCRPGVRARFQHDTFAASFGEAGLSSSSSSGRGRRASAWTRALFVAPLVSCAGALRHRRTCRAAGVAYGNEFVGTEVDDELSESLKERTLECLDFDFVLERLQKLCYTSVGSAMAVNPAELMAGSAEEARELYAAVLELTQLEDEDLDLENKLDIEQEIDQCSRGSVLEPPQLMKVSETLEALLRLRNGLEAAGARGVELPCLLGYCQQIDLPDQLLDVLLEAFEQDGELSVRKFPEIGELRDKQRHLEDACQKTIGEVLSSGKYASYLSEDGYMQVGGNYTLSVKPQHASKVGRIMDQSRSGRVFYVEPHELTGLSADLAKVQQELKFAIRRIMGAMSVQVSRSAEDLRKCLQAAAQIDLARARLFLGEDMQGEVPDVRDEGVIQVRQARNPCLLLRGGKRVVGYRLELGGWSQGLILSGPNAGGKTVVLKTLGLLALLARCGIPVPGGEAPRVDFFEVVLAEVGDMQTIVDDLSTYSAHLVASRIMLSVTKDTGSRSLVLVDEAGTGTDPQQGAALARAVLEAFLERGARVVATTHCTQLKNWALEDSRTETAAMEYKEGRPTFRIARNSVGESHAIETALRLDLPKTVVQRAEELLSQDEQQLLQLQRQAADREKEMALATEKAKAREVDAVKAQKLAEEKAKVLAQKQEYLESMEAELLSREDRMRSQLKAELKAKVAARERHVDARVEAVVARLKQESEQLGSHLRIVGNSLEDLRIEQDKAASIAEQRAKALPGALTATEKLSLGDWVMVLARTPWYGFKGRVQRTMGARVTVSVEGSGQVIEVDKTELGRTTAPLRKKTSVEERVARETARAAAGPDKAVKPVHDYSQMNW